MFFSYFHKFYNFSQLIFVLLITNNVVMKSFLSNVRFVWNVTNGRTKCDHLVECFHCCHGELSPNILIGSMTFLVSRMPPDYGGLVKWMARKRCMPPPKRYWCTACLDDQLREPIRIPLVNELIECMFV